MQRALHAPARDVGPVARVVEVGGRELDRVDFLADAHRLAQPHERDVVREDVVHLRRRPVGVSAKVGAEQRPGEDRLREDLLEAPVSWGGALRPAVVLASHGPVGLHLLAVLAVEAVAAQVHLKGSRGALEIKERDRSRYKALLCSKV